MLNKVDVLHQGPVVRESLQVPQENHQLILPQKAERNNKRMKFRKGMKSYKVNWDQ